MRAFVRAGLVTIGIVGAVAACNGILGIDAPTLVDGGGGTSDGSRPDVRRDDAKGQEAATMQDGKPSEDGGRGDVTVDAHHDAGHEAGRDARAEAATDEAGKDAPAAFVFDGNCACEGDACQPRVIATADGSVGGLAVGPTGVFFSTDQPSNTDGQVFAVLFSSGQSFPLLTSSQVPEHLAVDGNDSLLWIDPLLGAVEECSAVGLPGSCASPVAFALMPGLTGLIGANASNVYWESVNGLYECPVSGCGGAGPMPLPVGNNFGLIAVDDGGVAWSSTSGPIYFCPTAGCGDAAVPLISTTVVQLASTGGVLFWFDGAQIYACDDLTSAGACDTHSRLVVSGDAGIEAQHLVADSTGLYWAQNGAGQVFKVPLDGGAITTLATGRAQPDFVALGASCVFWDEGSGGFDGFGVHSIVAAKK